MKSHQPEDALEALRKRTIDAVQEPLERFLDAVDRLSIHDLAEMMMEKDASNPNFIDPNSDLKKTYDLYRKNLLSKDHAKDLDLRGKKLILGGDDAPTVLTPALQAIQLPEKKDLFFKLEILSDLGFEDASGIAQSISEAKALNALEKKFEDYRNDPSLKGTVEHEIASRIADQSLIRKQLDNDLLLTKDLIDSFDRMKSFVAKTLNKIPNEDCDAFIKSFNETYSQIIHSSAIPEKKLQDFEQAVIDVYWKLRGGQKKWGQKLADKFETFLVTPDGLNLPFKYNIEIPHHINGKIKPILSTIELSDSEKRIHINREIIKASNNPIKEKKGSFNDLYTNLLQKIGKESSKTKDKVSLIALISYLKETSNKALSEQDKLDRMREKIRATYLLIINEKNKDLPDQKKLKERMREKILTTFKFFKKREDSLESILKAFLKKEFLFKKEELKLPTTKP